MVARLRSKVEDHESRRHAAETIGDLAKPLDGIATEALEEALSDQETEVRLAAAKALRGLAEEGDPDAVKALDPAKHVDGDPAVLCVGVQLQRRLSGGVGFDAASVLAPCLRHADPYGRLQGVRTLPEVADPGDEASIAAAASLLGDADEAVRKSAVESLSRLGGRDGHPAAAAAAAAAVSAHLPHEDANVCVAVISAFRVVALVDDPCAVPAIGKCLEHAETTVRREAIPLYRELVPLGNYLATAAVAALLVDPDDGVRWAAAEATLSHAVQGDVVAVGAVAAHGEHADERVRGAFVEALDAIAEFFKEKATAEGTCPDPNLPKAKNIGLADSTTRGLAMQILGITTNADGEAQPMKAAAEKVKEIEAKSGWKVKNAVDTAARMLTASLPAHAGGSGAMVILMQHLKDDDPNVLAKAKQALQDVAERAKSDACGAGDANEGDVAGAA